MTLPLHDTLRPAPDPHWNHYLVGEAAHYEQVPSGFRLCLADAHAGEYSDSQLDDFRAALSWRPPLSLTVRARFSHGVDQLRGTAGFGWWNNPFEGGRATQVAVGPQVLWFFFGSPPSQLATTPGWSGQGWFAQGMRVPTLPGWLVKAGMLALRLPFLKPLARQGAEQVSRAAERPLAHLALTEWHEYQIVWQPDLATFWVDGAEILRYPSPPQGPLGLVFWMDNQWATVDGEGGLLDIPQRQWLELAEINLERPDDSRPDP